MPVGNAYPRNVDPLPGASVGRHSLSFSPIVILSLSEISQTAYADRAESAHYDASYRDALHTVDPR
jgi:hypothetical protein